ncbi:hypothetical protein [Pedobacter frigoris]|nr:hypothetical protein [Pedobacter frigoris]
MQYIKRSILFTLLVLASVTPLKLSAQSTPVGEYRLSNSSLELNADSTFTFRWGVCLTHRWSSGKWRINNDTIYFKVVPIYDTVTYSDNRIKVNHTFLSEYGESGHTYLPISAYHFIEPKRWSTQEEDHFPKKLFFQKNKLYAIANDKRLIRKKEGGSLWRKGYPTWYTKGMPKL